MYNKAKAFSIWKMTKKVHCWKRPGHCALLQVVDIWKRKIEKRHPEAGLLWSIDSCWGRGNFLTKLNTWILERLQAWSFSPTSESTHICAAMVLFFIVFLSALTSSSINIPVQWKVNLYFYVEERYFSCIKGKRKNIKESRLSFW